MRPVAARNTMRERFREQVREDIKAAALEQLTTGGAQSISIKAIAKQLGVSGTALYRYFANRDDLLTALVVDAYGDLSRALKREFEDRKAPLAPEARVRGLARAYRAWALSEPHRYELLFKPPLPGYDAHSEPLAAAARSLMEVLLATLHGIDDAEAPIKKPVPATGDEVLAARSAGTEEFHLAVSVWARLHGIVSLELGGGFTAMHLDADALFERELRVLTERLH
ncbi:TetR family transcriptional regulator [Amycolatopsis sp. WAC 01375]|uniref:TetR/AcrR family transcriptional regulator n=1 Tax=Amycolatopsis sp. WAC 01375 TaxID=2203194 RepID=UPI000F78F546|nr:TetR/AcrR family transcriptional regulator [Amycolatopsis sp. WAC 01375]RSM69314.1 TetR family transcriptional regulator [Amycolatopsis sp. WAC 01375]